MFFEIGCTSLLPTAFKFDIKLHLKPFFLKKNNIFLHFLAKKNLWIEDNFSEKLLNFCPFNYTYLGKNHFNVISAWSEMINLKSDQLEILLSVSFDFSLSVKAATLIFISGCGSAISSAKEGESCFIYNLVNS